MPWMRQQYKRRQAQRVHAGQLCHRHAATNTYMPALNRTMRFNNHPTTTHLSWHKVHVYSKSSSTTYTYNKVHSLLCARNKTANGPSRDSNSSKVPRSMTSPFSRTTITSAILMADNLCATITVVLFCFICAADKRLKTACCDSSSNALVASSRRRIGALRTRIVRRPAHSDRFPQRPFESAFG